MKVHFVTPTRISLINLTTIGDSEKREDDTKIGKFSSGMAYSTALLLRDGVKLNIEIFGGKRFLDKDNIYEENYTESVGYHTKTLNCTSTGKSKEVVVLDYVQKSLLTPSQDIIKSETIETAFALQLGYNWAVWMSYREIMSNVLDEGGYVVVDEYPRVAHGTLITLEFDESNEFYEVWQNRHLYMNFEEPLFKVSTSVECLENRENYLRIYKQNILVYEDKEKPSRFAWNIKMGEIDERRILSNLYSVEQNIGYAIQTTENEEFLRRVIRPTFETEEEEFLSSNYHYSDHISDLVNKIATEVYEEFGEVRSYDWLIDKVRKQKDCKIGGKKIKTIEDSLWNYSTEVIIETTPQPLSEPSITADEIEYVTPFAWEIKKYYNFELDVEVKIAKLKGSKCVADLYEKCLIIDENFDIQKDFHTFIVVYLELTQKGNVVENLAKYICNLIKK